ncbi:MAG: CoA transferase [Pikeienuella sp.]
MNPGTRLALTDLATAVDWPACANELTVTSGAAGIASSFPVSDIATAAYGALALAGAELLQLRGGPTFNPTVDRRQAGLAMAGNTYLTVDGTPPVEWDAITGYYKCQGDGWVYLHGNFPHHRDGLLTLFGVPAEKAAMAAKLSTLTAQQAETMGQSAGLCVMKLRTRQEWQAHGQYFALKSSPVVAITSLASGQNNLPALSANKPLCGIRVLDLSRVIAGPMAGRALAELGADVLRVGADGLPYFPALAIDTGFGKRWTHIDITRTKGRNSLAGLIAEADVVIDGFRPGALAAKGFSPKEMVDINPNLTIATLSAFSDIGPWANRRGYDSYVQSGVGLTAPIVQGDAPVRLPCQPLDYLSGCLIAFGTTRALAQRLITGGTHQVEVSLARTAMWFWDMADQIGAEPDQPDENLSITGAKSEKRLRQLKSSQGTLSALAPPYGYKEDELIWSGPPPLIDADQPEWLSRK